MSDVEKLQKILFDFNNRQDARLKVIEEKFNDKLTTVDKSIASLEELIEEIGSRMEEDAEKITDIINELIEEIGSRMEEDA
jgi:hypothetical protein